ncbi:hypothetical protein BT69DRAFT_1281096 [Atractiella rhizophila]|nr:hypothetical protein BT69DRAFT_1281096 [Atractiella rhizophila]
MTADPQKEELLVALVLHLIASKQYRQAYDEIEVHIHSRQYSESSLLNYYLGVLQLFFHLLPQDHHERSSPSTFNIEGIRSIFSKAIQLAEEEWNEQPNSSQGAGEEMDELIDQHETEVGEIEMVALTSRPPTNVKAAAQQYLGMVRACRTDVFNDQETCSRVH